MMFLWFCLYITDAKFELFVLAGSEVCISSVKSPHKFLLSTVCNLQGSQLQTHNSDVLIVVRTHYGPSKVRFLSEDIR
jgi:hypothetical protein